MPRRIDVFFSSLLQSREMLPKMSDAERVNTIALFRVFSLFGYLSTISIYSGFCFNEALMLSMAKMLKRAKF